MRDHELVLWLAELIKAGPEAAEAQGVDRSTYERGRTASAWRRRRLTTPAVNRSRSRPASPTLGGLGWSQALRALAACEGILYTDTYGTGTTDT
jgi:hypothetical protein